MSQIDGLNNIVQILRRRIADNAKKIGRSGKPSTQTKASQSSEIRKATTEELHTAIHERIRALDPDDERYTKIATRIFLESVLQWEFGEELTRDQKFSDMISEINDTIQSDQKIRQDMQAVLKQLALKV